MTIRPYDEQDVDAVARLSLRAWKSGFDSIKQALEPAVYRAIYPDGWRTGQSAAVRTALAEQDVWVAERDGVPIGFVSIVLHREDSMGEIQMVAVDPDHQRDGVGTALNNFALDWITDADMDVAMVETGGDPGHAAARRTYEKAGFKMLPLTRYLKAL